MSVFANCRRDAARRCWSAPNDSTRVRSDSFAEYQVTLVEQPCAWYGWDPIHHRRRADGSRGKQFWIPGAGICFLALCDKKNRLLKKIFFRRETTFMAGLGGVTGGPRGKNGAAV